MLGIALDPLDALAFDIGCDTVMLDLEHDARKQPPASPETSIKKGLSPDELWEALS